MIRGQILGDLERASGILHTDVRLVVIHDRFIPAELATGKSDLIPVALVCLSAHGAFIILTEAFQLLPAGGLIHPHVGVDPRQTQRFIVLLFL